MRYQLRQSSIYLSAKDILPYLRTNVKFFLSNKIKNSAGLASAVAGCRPGWYNYTKLSEKRSGDMLTPAEFVKFYLDLGEKKTAAPATRLLVLGMLAGLLIGFGACVSNTATFAIENPSVARIISGVLFPFGLFIVIMTGAELFTGNNLIAIGVLDRRVRLGGMLRNWLYVYLGNLLGSCILAAGVTLAGQLDLGSGALAAHTIKVAANKCALSFGKALLLGVFCNILVCIAVMCSSSAKSVPGRAVGAYLPISFFVICGFEHCVANMYYIPAGLFAKAAPQYAQLIAAAGPNTAQLTWAGFFINNLLPVTLGNIIGGVLVAWLLWFAYGEKTEKIAV